MFELIKNKPIYILMYLLKLYIMNFPIKKGKGLLKKIVAAVLSKHNRFLLVISEDNRKFMLKLPEDKSRLTIFSTGYCEKHLTLLFQKIIRKDDVIFDIGANIGWYTTLFALKGKECHAFEPNPLVFGRMVNNCKLNAVDSKCKFNNYALGNEEGIASFYNFKNLSHGLSSLSDFNRKDKEEIKVKITTCTKYIEENSISKVDLIKVDVEGSELNVLKGFEKLLTVGFTPIWIFELNDETSEAFDYKSLDILTTLQRYNYSFFLVKDKLIKLENLNAYKHGDEVLCIIPEIHRKRFNSFFHNI